MEMTESCGKNDSMPFLADSHNVECRFVVDFSQHEPAGSQQHTGREEQYG
jgi:hypothetical protein